MLKRKEAQYNFDDFFFQGSIYFKYISFGFLHRTNTSCRKLSIQKQMMIGRIIIWEMCNCKRILILHPQNGHSKMYLKFKFTSSWGGNKMQSCLLYKVDFCSYRFQCVEWNYSGFRNWFLAILKKRMWVRPELPV